MTEGGGERIGSTLSYPLFLTPYKEEVRKYTEWARQGTRSWLYKVHTDEGIVGLCEGRGAMTKMRGEIEALQATLRRIATEAGADLFGVADLSAVKDYLKAQGGEAVARFPMAISLAVRLPDAVVNGLERHEDRAALFSYQHLYNAANATLDSAALRVAQLLQSEGYEALPVAASQTVFPEKLAGLVSHKLAAHLAGLGWIGKSCLLVTPQYGPRVRLATVLTDAPLEPDAPIDERCGDCRRCVDTCPAHAFTGAPFNPLEPREARFKAELCRDYTQERARRFGSGLCGLCVHVCPHGRKPRTKGASRP